MDFLLYQCELPYRKLYLDDDGLYAVVDQQDYEWAHRHVWTRKQSKKGMGRRVKWYACRTGWLRGVKMSIYLHVVITKMAHGSSPTTGLVADHCNGDSLDCRRLNLRWATRSQNRRNIDGAYARQGRLEGV